MKNSTRLSLTSLDDRIVPSTSLADPNQSGVVNAIHIEGTVDGGVTTGPYRPSEGDSSVVLMNSSNLPPVYGLKEFERLNRYLEQKYGVVNGIRNTPEPANPAPRPQFVDANGVTVPPRPRSEAERAQIKELIELTEKNNIILELYDDTYLRLEFERIELMKRPVENQAAIKANADRLNSLADSIYMLQRNNVEMQDAMLSISRAATKGYPADSVVAPPHVFNPNRIGTDQGGSTWIQAVLKEK